MLFSADFYQWLINNSMAVTLINVTEKMKDYVIYSNGYVCSVSQILVEIFARKHNLQS